MKPSYPVFAAAVAAVAFAAVPLAAPTAEAAALPYFVVRESGTGNGSLTVPTIGAPVGLTLDIFYFAGTDPVGGVNSIQFSVVQSAGANFAFAAPAVYGPNFADNGTTQFVQVALPGAGTSLDPAAGSQSIVYLDPVTAAYPDGSLVATVHIQSAGLAAGTYTISVGNLTGATDPFDGWTDTTFSTGNFDTALNSPFTITVAPVPETSAVGAAAAALVGAALLRRRFRAAVGRAG